MANNWPEIDYLGWRDTCSALHLYLQIVGKYRLARTPWVNHAWHATFLVTPRGWTTTVVPDGSGIEVMFDLIEHRVVAQNCEGGVETIALEPTTVAAFHEAFKAAILKLGGNPKFHGSPNEVPNPVPFADDHRERPYDRDAVTRFFRATVQVDRVFKAFRTSFLGKASPVHLFWGSFDLAVTRFSGRPAPLHPGGIPALPDSVAREAYDHEVSSAGFWPGGGGIDYPAFYSYAYPGPEGFKDATVAPDEAFWSKQLGEFLLPYDAVRNAPDPDAALMAFLVGTYEAAAELAQWDRQSLECRPGEPGAVRAVRQRPVAPKTVEQTDLTVEHEANGAKGRYVIRHDGTEAEMTYSRVGDRLLIIDHTGVPDALRGKGMGERMVRQAVEDARAGGYAIMPLCPFAKAQIARHPDWQDVLQKR
ncbi:N-acetyltransferase [Mesorhizobium sp. RP14(2022)]|uniref:N-acetyltransferase n=1 Tax=Mesorhizobium liriopis TaxID=2953882 RepID=A0ABT1C575_9HYPH|nr:DUF5996 family protein [Mesorhizobium liriopis]MCO6049982.1 N-acetyltransferase [Mesorhizobium liriopis]